jgi:hypothetical protein
MNKYITSLVVSLASGGLLSLRLGLLGEKYIVLNDDSNKKYIYPTNTDFKVFNYVSYLVDRNDIVPCYPVYKIYLRPVNLYHNPKKIFN